MKCLGNINSSIIVIGCFHGDEPQGKYLIEKYLKQNPETKILFIEGIFSLINKKIASPIDHIERITLNSISIAT